MNKITELQARIGELSFDEAKAQQTHQNAAMRLAGQPRNSDFLNDVQVAERGLANIRGEVYALNLALEAMRQDANSEESKAKRQQLAVLVPQIKSALKARDGVAEEIDQALDNLKAVLARWTETNQGASEKLGAFYRGIFSVEDRGMEHFGQDSRGLSDCIANAMAAELDEALAGVNMRSNVGFNYLRRKLNTPERAAADARNASANLIDRLNGVAKAEGI